MRRPGLWRTACNPQPGDKFLIILGRHREKHPGPADCLPILDVLVPAGGGEQAPFPGKPGGLAVFLVLVVEIKGFHCVHILSPGRDAGVDIRGMAEGVGMGEEAPGLMDSGAVVLQGIFIQIRVGQEEVQAYAIGEDFLAVAIQVFQAEQHRKALARPPVFSGFISLPIAAGFVLPGQRPVYGGVAAEEVICYHHPGIARLEIGGSHLLRAVVGAGTAPVGVAVHFILIGIFFHVNHHAIQGPHKEG